MDGGVLNRILLVDDDQPFRFVMKTMLETHGFDVVGEAEDGAKAEQAYVDLKPDLVLLDVSMPVKNGVDALKSIMQGDPRACVVMLTSMGQVDMMDDAITAGAKDFIRKDSNIEDVPSRLHQILG